MRKKSWEEIINKLGNSDNLLLLKKPFEASEIKQLAAVLTRKWELNHLADLQMTEQISSQEDVKLEEQPHQEGQKSLHQIQPVDSSNKDFRFFSWRFKIRTVREC